MSRAPFILVCDDTRNLVDLLVSALRQAGYRAEGVTGALDCIRIARKDRPDLILMDVMMPGMDGAMATELFDETPELQGIPILLMSAMPESDLRARAQESGAAGFLAKPFRRETVLRQVAQRVLEPVFA